MRCSATKYWNRLREGLTACPNVRAGQIVVYGGGQQLLAAWTMLGPRNWIVGKDSMQAATQSEDAWIAREQAERERRERAAQARKLRRKKRGGLQR